MSESQTIAAPGEVRAEPATGGSPSHRIVVEHDDATGPRLKYYSRAADVEYWTERWRNVRDVSYERERRGHLPHQLRATFRRWVQPGAKVLEAGCGLGHFTVATHALGYRAEGVDWARETIEGLRERFPEIPWHVGDVRRMDFRAGAFDALYSPGVCEHVEEGPIATLAEARRVLRIGGIAVVSTPCFNVWLQRHAVNVTASSSSASREFYQYAFTPDGMARLLIRIGFDVLQVRPYDTLSTLVQYAGCRVPPVAVGPVAIALDSLPVVRNWGSTCIWIARKR